jgi:hypothetical protein
MKWKILLFIFFPATVVVSFSVGVLGRWRPGQLPGIMIHVMEEKVVGTVDDRHSVEMTIVRHNKNKIWLDNIQLKKKPSDWFNVIKYKDYIDIFRKIRKMGVACQYDFVDENNLEILSTIGDEQYKFILKKILE